MHPCLEKITDFTSAALVPGKLIIDDRRFDKAEGNNQRYFNPVVALIDFTTYGLGAGMVGFAYDQNIAWTGVMGALILGARGALGLRTNADRRRFENNYYISKKDLSLSAKDSTPQSKFLPGR